MTQHQENESNALEQGREFLEKNQNVLIATAIIVVLVVGFLFYRNYQTQQQEEAAKPMMNYAQEYFRADSFNLALNGDGANPGFLNIIDEYGRSSSANLAHFYAGVSYYRMGNPTAAIEFLEDFSTDSEFLEARKYELLGHAYSDLGESKEAARHYRKAANSVDNDFFTPYYLQVAGDYYLFLEQYKDAKEMYEEIHSEYPNSTQGQGVEKYIKMVETKLKHS